MHCVQVSLLMFYQFGYFDAFIREVGEDYPQPHLIYTPTGGADCFSNVGRVVSKPGQIVNLGSPECLSVGKILHETLHALGLPFFSTIKPKPISRRRA